MRKQVKVSREEGDNGKTEETECKRKGREDERCGQKRKWR